MPNKLVSVIIPAYNHEKYVQVAINSVIDQTYNNIELIVVDDGSIDSTWIKIKELQSVCEQRFRRVIFETQSNMGTCITINKLLGLSRGEYIHLLASDDMLTPISTERLCSILDGNPACALAVGRNLIMDSDDKVCYWDEQRNNVYEENESEWLSFSDYLMQTRKDVDFYSDNFGSYLSLLRGNYIPNGYLIRREIFEKIGLFTMEAPLEDYFLMLQIAKYAKMQYIDEPTFIYRWHGSNQILQHKKMRALERKTSLYEYKIVQESGDEKAKSVMQQFLRKDIINIMNVIKIYKINNMINKKICLEFLGLKLGYVYKIIS